MNKGIEDVIASDSEAIQTEATPGNKRCAFGFVMRVCGFDLGLETRIRGGAGPVKPSAFICTRNHDVDYLRIHCAEVFRRNRMPRNARIGFAPNSLLIPCSAN